MAIKFVRINKEIWDSYTDSLKNLYKNSIVFVKDSKNSTTGQLWSDGAYFGTNNSTFTINEKYNDSFMETSESDSTTYNIIKNVTIDDIILWRGNDCEYKVSNLLGDTYSNLDVKNIKLTHNHLYKVKFIKHNGKTYQYLIHLNNYDYLLPVASNDTLGGIKTGYITNNSKYAVNVDENNNAYVEIISNEKTIKEFYSTGFIQINEGSALLDITGTKIEDGEIAKYIGMVDNDGNILEESIEWTNITDIFPKTLTLTRNNEYKINYVIVEDVQYIIIKPINIDIVQSDWNENNETSLAFIKNKPILSTVAISGNYYDLEDYPESLSEFYNDLNIQWKDIKNKPEIPAYANEIKYIDGDNITVKDILDSIKDYAVLANWNQSDYTEPDFIKGKPTIGNGKLTLKAGNNEIIFNANQSINTTFEIKTSDLGLSAALTYCGVTTTALTDGSTTNPIIIKGDNHNAKAGCVVFYDNKEYVWNGFNWEELGYPTTIDLNGYKTKQTVVNDPTANGSSDTFISTISQNANGEITVTKKNVEHLNIVAGNGIQVNKNGKDVTISGNNDYRVWGKTIIAKTKNLGSSSYELNGYAVASNVTNKSFNIFNISDISDNSLYVKINNLQYNYHKTSADEEYIGLAYFSSTAGYYIFDVTVDDDNTNSNTTHTFCVLFDTPNSTAKSGLFTLVTTLNWDIIVKKTNRLDSKGNPYDTEFFAYLKIPKKVQGYIKITPRGYNIISGVNFGLLNYKSGVTDPVEIINIKNVQNPSSSTTIQILSFDEPIGNDIGDKLNTPVGKYKIDTIHEFGKIALQDIIDGNLINNLLLTSFNNELISIRQMI